MQQGHRAPCRTPPPVSIHGNKTAHFFPAIQRTALCSFRWVSMPNAWSGDVKMAHYPRPSTRLTRTFTSVASIQIFRHGALYHAGTPAACCMEQWRGRHGWNGCFKGGARARQWLHARRQGSAQGVNVGVSARPLRMETRLDGC